MMLLIDSGNSRVKLGWFDRACGAREAEALAVEHRDVHVLRAWLARLPRAPRAAIGANVAGETAASRIQATLELPVTWMLASPHAGGVRNGYATPSQLGADRWMALLGLTAQVALPYTPLLLANVGTATTIDTLSPQDTDGMRDFIGGVILPGVRLMRTSLAQHTAQLTLMAGQTTAFPTHTGQAITSGVCAAQAGAVVQQWRHTFERFGRPPAVYLSGGGGDQVSAALESALKQVRADVGLAHEPVHTIRSPVLDGLARIGAEMALTR